MLCCALVVLGATTPGLAGGVVGTTGDGGTGGPGATATATTASCTTLSLNATGTTLIGTAGCYVLTGNVTDADADPLILVSASDVTIDGQGYTVDGVDRGSAIATDDTLSQSNVTVRDVRLRDWGDGVTFNRTTDGVVRNVTVVDGPGIGVGLGNFTSQSVVRNVRVERMDTGGIGIAPTASLNALRDVYVNDVPTGPGVRIDGDDNEVVNVTVDATARGFVTVGGAGNYGTDLDVSGTGTGVVVRGGRTTAATDTEIQEVRATDTDTAFRTEIGPVGTPNTNNSFPFFTTSADTTIDIEKARSVTISPNTETLSVDTGTAALGPAVDTSALASDAYLDFQMAYDPATADGVPERSIRVWKRNDSGWAFLRGDNEALPSQDAVRANATTFGTLAPVGITDLFVASNTTVDSGATVSHTFRAGYLGMSGGGQQNTVYAVFDDTVAGNLTLEGVTATDLDGSRSYTVTNTGVVDGPDGDGNLDTLTADVSADVAERTDARVDFDVTVAYPAVNDDTTVPVDRRIVDAAGTVDTGPWENVSVVAADGEQVVTKEADIEVSPTDIGFGSVPVNSTATAEVNVSNEGQAGLSVSEIEVDGVDEDLFEVDADAFSLDAGEYRTVTVTFAPTETGAVDAELVVRSDDPDRSRLEVGLDGIAINSDMSVDRSRLDFGSTRVGTTTTRSLTVRNDGAANLTVETLSLAGANATAFDTGRATLSVPSSTERTVNVTFTPDTAGPKAATLSLVSENSGTIGVRLVGNGTRSALDAPNSVVFEPTPAGTTRSRTVQLANGGTTPLELSAVEVSGPNATAYRVANATRTIPANGTGELRLTFAPTTAGPTNATLTLRGPTGPTNVSLAGVGVGPRPSVTPATVTFGNVSVGTTVRAQLAVTNTGGGTLNVTDLSLTGTGAGAYDVAGVPSTLAAGEQRTVNVTFTPSERGPRAATLAVETNAGRETVSLNGSGAAVTLSVSPLSLSFGATTPADPVTRTVTVTNRGSRSVNVSDLRLRGANRSSFVVATDAPLAVPPDDSREVRVRFAPRSTGTATARLVLSSDDASVPTSTVSLQGSGSVPDVLVTPGSLTFGEVAVDETVTRNLTVANDGSAPLDVRDVSLTSGIEDAVELRSTARGAIGPGERQTVTVAFTPAERRTYSGTLQVVTDDPDEPVVPVWVSNSNTTATLSLTAGRNRTNFSANVSNVEPGSEVGFEFGGTGSERSDTALTGVAVEFSPDSSGGNASTPATGAALSVARPTDGVARQADDGTFDFTLDTTSSATPLADAPGFRTDADATVGLRYVDVTHSFPNSAVENASLTFRVDRERIESLRGTDPEDVVVYRYADGEWVERPTEIVAENDGTLVLRATADGFSDWTVGAKQASFEVVRADVSVSSVTLGDSVNVNVRIENTGGADGQFLTELLLNEEVVDSREVEIAAGGTAQVTFDRSFGQPGTYRVRVNDVPAGSVEVAEGGTDAGTGTAGGTATSSGSGDALGPLLVALVVSAAAAAVGRRRRRD